MLLPCRLMNESSRSSFSRNWLASFASNFSLCLSCSRSITCLRSCLIFSTIFFLDSYSRAFSSSWCEACRSVASLALQSSTICSWSASSLSDFTFLSRSFSRYCQSASSSLHFNLACSISFQRHSSLCASLVCSTCTANTLFVSFRSLHLRCTRASISSSCFCYSLSIFRSQTSRFFMPALNLSCESSTLKACDFNNSVRRCRPSRLLANNLSLADYSCTRLRLSSYSLCSRSSSLRFYSSAAKRQKRCSSRCFLRVKIVLGHCSIRALSLLRSWDSRSCFSACSCRVAELQTFLMRRSSLAGSSSECFMNSCNLRWRRTRTSFNKTLKQGGSLRSVKPPALSPGCLSATPSSSRLPVPLPRPFIRGLFFYCFTSGARGSSSGFFNSTSFTPPHRPSSKQWNNTPSQAPLTQSNSLGIWRQVEKWPACSVRGGYGGTVSEGGERAGVRCSRAACRRSRRCCDKWATWKCVNEQNEQLQNQMIKKLEVVIPPGLQIRESKFGYGLFTTRSFEQGEIIYRHKAAYVPDDDTVYEFTTVPPSGQSYRIDRTNSVQVGARRVLYTFDGFTNHSCSENTTSFTVSDDGLGSEYEIQTRRRIEPGEQITCNYLHFDYTCDGHNFKCCCGSPKCYGEIKGFRQLSLDQKIELLPFVCVQLKQLWIQDCPEILLLQDLQLPTALAFDNQYKGSALVVKTDFSAGEIICNVPSLKFTKQQVIIFKLGKKYYLHDQKLSPGEDDCLIFNYLQTFLLSHDHPNVAAKETEEATTVRALVDLPAGTHLRASPLSSK